jgi:hypothetical protein
MALQPGGLVELPLGRGSWVESDAEGLRRFLRPSFQGRLGLDQGTDHAEDPTVDFGRFPGGMCWRICGDHGTKIGLPTVYGKPSDGGRR